MKTVNEVRKILGIVNYFIHGEKFCTVDNFVMSKHKNNINVYLR